MAGMALMALGEYLPKLRFFKASIQSYRAKLFLQSIPAPQIHKAAPQSSSPQLLPKAVPQSTAAKKSVPQSGSAKLVSKVAPESCSAKLLSKAAPQNCILKLRFFKAFVRSCRTRLFLKATPTSQTASQSCSTKLFPKIVIENSSE